MIVINDLFPAAFESAKADGRLPPSPNQVLEPIKIRTLGTQLLYETVDSNFFDDGARFILLGVH